MQHSSATLDRSRGQTDYDDLGAAPRPLTLREQVLWTLFGIALLVSFLVLLIEDQIV